MYLLIIQFTRIEPILLIDSVTSSVHVECQLYASTALGIGDIKLIKAEILPSWCSLPSGDKGETTPEQEVACGQAQEVTGSPQKGLGSHELLSVSKH